LITVFLRLPTLTPIPYYLILFLGLLLYFLMHVSRLSDIYPRCTRQHNLPNRLRWHHTRPNPQCLCSWSSIKIHNVGRSGLRCTPVNSYHLPQSICFGRSFCYTDVHNTDQNILFDAMCAFTCNVVTESLIGAQT